MAIRILNDSFLAGSIAFILGVAVSSVIDVGFSFAIFIILCSLTVGFYAWFKVEKEHKKIFLTFAIIILLFSFGSIRYHFKDLRVENTTLTLSVEKVISTDTEIVSEPIEKEFYREYKVKTSDGEKFLVRADLYPKFEYGDQVTFEGRLVLPEAFIDERGKEFDYPSYLAKDDIYYLLTFAKGEIIAQNQGSFLRSKLYYIKNAFVRSIEINITEPAASLLNGILLGIEDSMGKDLEDVFRKTGIIHIVVLSGYNITLVVSAIYAIFSKFSFLSKKGLLLVETVGIIFFVLMVGGSPSVLRAAIMAILVLIARGTGRTYLAGRAIVATLVLMIIWNPKSLVFDTGFALSFLATAAIVWISPLVKEKLSFISNRFSLREIFADTLSTQIFVLPLLLYKTGLFSAISILVNILVLPAVPLAMFFGFIAGATGIVSAVAAIPFAALSRIILTYIISIAESFSRIPFSSFLLPDFPMFLMIVIYAFYMFVIVRWSKKARIAARLTQTT